MVEPAFDRSIWQSLAREERASAWSARPVAAPCRAYIALDRSGHRHLLVEAPRDTWVRDDMSRGLRLMGQELAVAERPMEPYLDLCCLEEAGHPAFDLVIDHVITQLRAGVAQASALRRTLIYWRRFWTNSLARGPSAEALRGLFGELWFLFTWLLPRIPGAVYQWKGPSDSRHDFEWPTRSVEVKTSAAKGPIIHRINGLEQLLPPESGDLFLFSLQARPEDGARETLFGLVQRIREQLAGDRAALDQFEFALSEWGYSPVLDPLFETVRMRIVSERLYHVRDDFPRLTPASFAGGPPGTISNIAYDLDLSACDAWVVAQQPDDWPPIS